VEVIKVSTGPQTGRGQVEHCPHRNKHFESANVGCTLRKRCFCFT